MYHLVSLQKKKKNEFAISCPFLPVKKIRNEFEFLPFLPCEKLNVSFIHLVKKIIALCSACEKKYIRALLAMFTDKKIIKRI